jgi:hypothetical protein
VRPLKVVQLRCPHCGTAEWEWEEDRDAYIAEARICRGCHRRHAEQKSNSELAEQFGGGLFVRLVKPGGDDGGSEH